MEQVKVYEVEEGRWTFEFAGEGEAWSKGEAIRRATEFARLNGTDITVDFPLETKARADELGINLYAKPSRPAKNTITDPWAATRRTGFDPFAGG